MEMKQIFLVLVAIFASQSLISKEIVVGVEAIPIKHVSLVFIPMVIPDLISAKAAFEYRMHRKLNLVIPVEAKWMDYRRAIKLGANLFRTGQEDVPEQWYKPGNPLRSLWNIDLWQLKISSGIGVKWFPLSESMTNAFFIKTLMMAGFERLTAYAADGRKDGAVFTHVLSLGYTWVKQNRFSLGLEIGEEYTWHTNPIKGLPILLDGLMPLVQFSLGLNI